MEKNYNEIAKQLRIILVSIYVIAGIIVAVFETGLVSKGLVSDKSTVYILEVIGVVMSLGLIPISLRGFKKTVSRIAEKRYNKCYRDINQYSNYRVQRRPVEAYKMLKGEIPRKHIINTEDLTINIVPFKGVLEEDYDEVDILHVDKAVLTDLINQAREDDLFGKGGYR